jgi:endonuclease/exonuclease/phosphatase family metal-dependent hydrolase
VKLIQLNAWAGRLQPQIHDLLEVEKPDILCLQEIISFDKHEETGLFITTEQMQKQFGLNFAALAPVFSFRYMRGMGHFGNGILSRYPIISENVVFTHQAHVKDFEWLDVANMRNFVHAIVEVSGKKCNILTHHGYWVPEHKHGNGFTDQQMQLLSDYVRKLEGPVILTGDFNLEPTSKSLVPLNEILTNLSIEAGLPTTRTELTYKTEVCDYIFVSEAVKIKEFRALDKVVSDHKALLLEFEL